MATIIGILVILWMSFSAIIPERYASLRNPLNTNMIIVIGTLAIFFAGVLLSRLRKKQDTVPA